MYNDIILGDLDQCVKAVNMILEKIADDPQSNSCPNISYADYKGMEVINS